MIQNELIWLLANCITIKKCKKKKIKINKIKCVIELLMEKKKKKRRLDQNVITLPAKILY